MLEPYRMITVNITALLILLTLFLAYKYIWPRKTPPYILMIFLISLLPLISLLRKGTYESGDLTLHAMRTYSYYKILFLEHNFPRWTPEFNSGYGDPHFIFTYLLPYLISSTLHFIGFSLITSIKLVLAISYIFSGIAMYLWIKNIFGKKAGFISAIFYLFAPYHLIDMHFRVSVAESMSFAFLPVCLLMVRKIINNDNKIYIGLGSVLFSLLILTHQIISLSFTPFLIIYGILEYKLKKENNPRDLFRFFVFISLSLGLSAFYWLPIIIESNYTQAVVSSHIVIFPKISELILSSWRYGLLFQGPNGEISYLIGYFHILIIIFTIFLILKRKLKNGYVFYFLFSIIFLIILMLPISSFLWKILPLLKYFQFSYRLLELIALFSAALAGILVVKTKYGIIISTLIIVTIASTILNWGNRKTLSDYNDKKIITEFEKHPDVGNYLEPSSPIFASEKSYFLRNKRKSNIDIINGKGEIIELSRLSNRHTYIINAKTAVVIKENTLYFPGWILKTNNKMNNFTYKNPDYPGVIIFNVGTGLSKIDLYFEDTTDRSWSNKISSISFLFLIYVLLENKLKINYKVLRK